MTNGDRIRQMSDFQLAQLLGYNCLCDAIQLANYEHCVSYQSCWDCLMDFLKKEAKDDTVRLNSRVSPTV